MSPIWRCVWCIKDSKTEACERCGGPCEDRTKPHIPHWSRKTMATVECKICDRSVSYEQMLSDNHCPGAGEKGQTQ